MRIEYKYPCGAIEREVWYMDNEIHRDCDLPAIIEYHPDGTIKRNTWFQSGMVQRDGNLPAMIDYIETDVMGMRYNIMYLSAAAFKCICCS